MPTESSGKEFINKFIDDQVAALEKIGVLDEDQQMLLKICQYIQANPQQISVADVCDNGKSLNRLLQQIDALPSFPVNFINLLEQNENTKIFMSWIKKMIENFILQYNHYLALTARTQSNTVKCDEIQYSIELEEALLESQIQAITKKIEIIHTHRLRAEKQIIYSQGAIEKNTIELNQLDDWYANFSRLYPDNDNEFSKSHTKARLHITIQDEMLKLARASFDVSELNKALPALITEQETRRMTLQAFDQTKEKALTLMAALHHLQKNDEAACATFHDALQDRSATLQHVSKLLQQLTIFSTVADDFSVKLEHLAATNNRVRHDLILYS